MRYHYYPLCTKDFTFENIFSSESISPPSLYPTRKFGIDYFYIIPKMHNENAIILYNAPPVYATETESSAIKFIIAISEEAFNQEHLIFVDEGILAYRLTIYLNASNCKIFFFSEKEKTITCLKSETSLPTKGLEKYSRNFEILSESSCRQFESQVLSSLSIPSADLNQAHFVDRSFNFLKGYVYGITAGIVGFKSEEELTIKKRLQEIVNCFAEIKNRSENSDKSVYARYQRPSFRKESVADASFSRLKDYLKDIKAVLIKLFPGDEFSEHILAEFLLKKFGSRFKSIESARQYIEYKIIDSEILGSNFFERLKEYFFRNTDDKNPVNFIEIISQLSDSLITGNVYTSKNNDVVYDQFKEAMFGLNIFLDDAFLLNSNSRTIDLDQIDYNISKSEIVITEDFMSLGLSNTEEFVTISNIILKHPKQGRGEAKKELILNLVELVGDAFTKTKSGKSTQLFQYLNNETRDYSVETVNSVVMKNFVAFVFNPDSIEKLESYTLAKSINQIWIAYAFWCAFNGFANTSRDLVKPIFNSSNQHLQNYLDHYLIRTLQQLESYTLANPTNSACFKNRKSDSESEVQLSTKNNDYFKNFIDKKFEINYDQFMIAIQLGNKSAIADFLKNEHNIPKKDSKKIIATYNEFMNSEILF